MSDAVNPAQAPVQPGTVESSTPTQTHTSMDSLSGSEAVALAREAKESGKTIEEVFAEKYNKASKEPSRGVDGKFQSSQPKEQSNQEAIKEAAAEAKRKLKIDDEEVDEDEVLKVYKSRKDHQRAANKELQEGKAAKKQALEFIEMMKSKEKLFEAIQKLGHDPRKLAEEYLVEQLQEENLDPRDKEFRDAKRKLQAYEDMERKQKEKAEKLHHEEMKTKFMKDYESQFISALNEVELPQTKAMVGEMAKYISRSAKIGFKMTPKEAAQLVREDIQKAQVSLIGNADGETLLKLLGEETANKILKARGSKVKQPQDYLATPKEQGERKPREQNTRMSHKEWREYNRKK